MFYSKVLSASKYYYSQEGIWNQKRKFPGPRFHTLKMAVSEEIQKKGFSNIILSKSFWDDLGNPLRIFFQVENRFSTFWNPYRVSDSFILENLEGIPISENSLLFPDTPQDF